MMKKSGSRRTTNIFDVSIGAYDGAEISELIGLLILSKTKEAFPEINFGIYRDDGLGVYKDIPGRARDQIRKKYIMFFTNFLEIIIKHKSGSAFVNSHKQTNTKMATPLKMLFISLGDICLFCFSRV